MKRTLLVIVLILLIIFFLGDLIFLNWKVLEAKPTIKTVPAATVDNPVLPSGIPEALTSCPQSCLSRIYEATASLKLSAPVSQKETTVTSQIKEIMITLGSGSSKAGDWEDINGVSAYIDSSKYGKIKSVIFEASVLIPNGNQGVYVRLFNTTDKHPVWFSEVYHEGGITKLLISPPLTLDSGNKLYQVQMKTTLKDLANLNQSRIRITTE